MYVGRSIGSRLATQYRILRTVDDESFQENLSGANGHRCRGDGLPSRGLFRLRLDDIERGERSHFDARLIVLDELGGQRQRPVGDFERLNREDVVPIRVARVGHRPHDGRPQRGLGYLLVQRGDAQRRARAVDPEIAQERLHVDGGEVGVDRGVPRGEEVGLLLTVVVEGDSKAAPAPFHVLRDAVVAGEGLGDEHVGAGRLTAWKLRLAADADVGVERRLVTSRQGGQRPIEGLWIQPLDGDVQVALERALHGFVERQLDSGSRLRGIGGTRLLEGSARFGELPRGFPRDLIEPLLFGALRERRRGSECEGQHRQEGTRSLHGVL